jgi:hypothetical protein
MLLCEFIFQASGVFILSTMLILGSCLAQNGTSKDWPCPMYGFDVPDGDLEVVANVASWEDCGYLCFQRADCQIWNWRINRVFAQQAGNQIQAGQSRILDPHNLFGTQRHRKDHSRDGWGVTENIPNISSCGIIYK